MSERPDLRIVEWPDTPLSDVPKRLHELADDIAAGKYGACGTCAVVVFADKLNVFGFGKDADAGAVHLCLSAAANRMLQPLLAHGRE